MTNKIDTTATIGISQKDMTSPTPALVARKGRTTARADAAATAVAPVPAALDIAPAAAPGVTRRSQLCALLARSEGADLAALCAHFGWQPHSARAALSGLRKAGMTIERRAAERPAVGPAAGEDAPVAIARYYLIAIPVVTA